MARALPAVALAIFCGLLCGRSAPAAPAPERISYGRFQNLAVYAPQGTPRSMVLLPPSAGLKRTVAELDRVLGIENVRVIHANDSKTPLGSHVDRHAKIGEGHIGAEAFRRLLAHPKMRGKTFISETPVEEDGDDGRNMATLRRLAP